MEAYPLSWPVGWPKHQGTRLSDSKFYGTRYSLSLSRARDQLLAELGKLGAADVVVSSNLPLRRDGLPTADEGLLRGSPGVAVYFNLRKRALVMAQDAYISVSGNMRSLAVAVEAMRALERHGGGTLQEKAFTGFLAIAPPSWHSPWREVMGFRKDAHPTRDEVDGMFRALSKLRHPDTGGSDAKMAELNVAYDEAKLEIDQRRKS